MRKKILTIFIVIFLFGGYVANSVYAVTQNDVNNLKNQKQEKEEELNNIKEEKQSAQDEVSLISSQINTVQDELDKLQSQLDEINSAISQKEAEITAKEQELKEKDELLKKRLVAMYKTGGTSYLDVLLGTSGALDMLVTYDAVKEITDADQKLIEQVSNQKNELENDKKDLVTKKNEVDSLKAKQQAKNQELSEKKSEKAKKVTQLSNDEKAKQAEIDKFEQDIRNAQADIERAKQEAIRQAALNGSKPSTSSGHINNSNGTLGWPLASNYARYSYITSYFGKRARPTAGASTNHGAIDIGVSYQPVYAAEAGLVVTAQYVSGYGNFIMIWHKEKGQLYTCYGHLSQYCVSLGETVSRGQQIAVSGNTGVSTGPHLHFEVRTGGSGKACRVDPLGYVSIS